MSRHTYHEVVPHKIVLAGPLDSREPFPDDNIKLSKLWQSMGDPPERDAAPDDPDATLVNGWKLYECGDYGDLMPGCIVYGDIVVHLVNSHEYECVGAVELVAFCDTLEGLEKFCHDFDIDAATIKSPASVMQVL